MKRREKENEKKEEKRKEKGRRNEKKKRRRKERKEKGVDHVVGIEGDVPVAVVVIGEEDQEVALEIDTGLDAIEVDLVPDQDLNVPEVGTETGIEIVEDPEVGSVVLNLNHPEVVGRKKIPKARIEIAKIEKKEVVNQRRVSSYKKLPPVQINFLTRSMVILGQ